MSTTAADNNASLWRSSRDRKPVNPIKSEEHSDNMSAIKKVAYSENKSGLRTTNDESSLRAGGCGPFRAHNYAYNSKEITCEGMVMAFIGEGDTDSKGNPAFVDDDGVPQASFMTVLFIGDDEIQIELSSEDIAECCKLVQPHTSIVGDFDWSMEDDSSLRGKYDMLSDDQDPSYKFSGHVFIGKKMVYTGLHPDRPWGTFDMLENNKPKSIKIGAGKKKEKITTGIYFDGRSGYTHFGWEVLGVTERVNNGKRGGVQRYLSIESQVSKRVAFAFGQQGCAGGLGLGFTRHPDNPILNSKSAVNSRALFYLKNFEYSYCPGFFQNGSTLSGYLDEKGISTVEKFREWQSGYPFKTPVLEKAYLHELNSRYDREYREANPELKGLSDYIASLEELPGGKLDLEGPARVDFYDHAMKDNNGKKKPATKRSKGKGSKPSPIKKRKSIIIRVDKKKEQKDVNDTRPAKRQKKMKAANQEKAAGQASLPSKSTDDDKPTKLCARPKKTVITSTSTVQQMKTKVVKVPPGGIGIMIESDGSCVGSVVTMIGGSSVLAGRVSYGDRLIAVDNIDVRALNAQEVLSIVARKSKYERTLTFLA